MQRRGGVFVRPLGAVVRRFDPRPARVLLSLAVVVGAAALARADGPAYLVKDINTVQPVREPYEDEPSSYPRDFAVLDGVVYFAAGDLYDRYGEGPNGDELWRSDGTPAGTYLVKDIYPGPPSAYPNSLQVHDGALYFVANDGSDEGAGLWRSDGTTAGTERVAGIGHTTWSGRVVTGLARLGSSWLFLATDSEGTTLQRVDDDGASVVVARLSSAGYGFSPSDAHIVAGDHLAYFSLFHEDVGTELWRTDGTAAGTTVLDLMPGVVGSNPRDLTVVGDAVYFGAVVGDRGGALWRADAGGAERLLDTDWNPFSLTAFDGGLLFIARQTEGDDWRLWRSDGTPGGTVPLAVLPGPPYWDQKLTPFGGALYFAAYSQLWRTDGTASGTAVVYGDDADPDLSQILAIADAGAELAFIRGPEYGSQVSLWRSDGSAAGTTVVRDFDPVTEWQWNTFADGRVTGGGVLIFPGDDGHGVEPWRSDLTAEGTSELRDITRGATDIFSEDAYPAFADVQGTLAFIAYDGAHGGLWRSDASAAGTVPISTIDGFYYAPALWPIGERVYFTQSTAEAGQELWELPSLDAQPRFLTDIFPGPNGSYPFLLGILDGELIVSADDGTHGTEPFAPYDDGLIADLQPGSYGSYPQEPVIMGGGLYFLAGRALWRTDGTPSGTSRIADFAPGDAIRMIGGSDRLAIITNSDDPEDRNRALWYSDGTPAGTVRVGELAANTDPDNDGYPILLGFAGRTLLFAGGDAAHGVELWSSDGTAAGTGVLVDIAPGATGSFPADAATGGDRVLFFADDGEHGREPWISDGSAAGTSLVADIQRGPLGSRSGDEAPAKVIGNAFVFAASDGLHGLELWQSDGSAAGTTLLQDIVPGPPSSSPRDFTVSGTHLFFTANDDEHGRELWAVPLRDVACSQDCPDPRTPTATPRRTPRPIWTPGQPLPTYTATPLPTRSTTPHCNAPGDGEDCVFLDVGSASGAPGEQVEIEVSFRTGGIEVAGVQLDLRSGEVLPYVRLEDGKPDCHVNPAIDKPFTAFSDPLHDGALLRALVLSVENVDPIPDDSLLFTCRYQIPADAALGTVPVHCENFLGSTPAGEAIPPPEGWVIAGIGEIRCNDGQVTIAYPTPTATPGEGERGISSGGAGGDGCQIDGATGQAHPLLLLAPLTLLLLRRRRAG